MSRRLWFFFISALLLSQVSLVGSLELISIDRPSYRNTNVASEHQLTGTKEGDNFGGENLLNDDHVEGRKILSKTEDTRYSAEKGELLQPGKDYVVFARSHFLELMNLLDEKQVEIKRVYPNLQAFRISADTQIVLPRSEHYQAYDVSRIRLRLSSTGDNFSLFGASDYTPIDIEKVWTKGLNGSGIVIGILDTKVVYSGVLEGKQFLTKVFVEGDDSNPYNLHATRVASLMVGYDNITKQPFGVAYGAKIANAQLGADSNGNLVGDVFQAMDWLGGIPEIDIINFSFGGPSIADNDPIEVAAEALVRLGKLVIASVGNYGPSKWYQIGTPSSSPELIGVGASSGSTSIASLSSGGPTAFFEPKPDVVAPGQNIEVTPGEIGHGTSFAAPIVSGVAALLTQYLKNKTVSQTQALVKASIIKGAHPIVDDQRIEGMGLVNASRSLEILENVVNDTQSPSEFLSVQPRSAPLDVMSEIATNARFVQRILVTSTNLDQLQATIEGNLSNYASLELFRKGQITSTYRLIVTAPDFATQLVGGVLFSLGSINDSISIRLNVTDYWRGIGLIDLKHTNWDDTGANLPHGSNLGEFFNLLLEEKIFPELFRIGDLASLDFAKYGFVMIPDGFDYVPPEDKPYVGTLELSDPELEALTNYVASGGSLILEFIGPTNNGGTDPSKIDDLLASFGLTLSDGLASQTIFAADVVNTTSINFGTEAITHLGTSIAYAGPTTFPLAQLGDGKVVATYTQTGKSGRVFVVTSNFPFDNFGIKNEYTRGKNREFVKTILNQALDSTHIFVEEVKVFSNSTFSITVKSQSPVFVQPGGKALVALTPQGADRYRGLVPISTAPATITVFNAEMQYVQWNLTTSFLELPKITIPATEISSGAWNTIAVLQYEGSAPTDLFYLASATLGDEQLPLKIEQVNSNTVYVRLSPHVSDIVMKKENPIIFLSILNSRWEAKTLVITSNGTSFTPTEPPSTNTSALKKVFVFLNDYWYVFLFATLLITAIFVIRRKNVQNL